MRRSWARVTLATAFLGAAGCAPRIASVSGVVTLDGKPLPGAAVTFLPTVKGVDPVGSSYGRTDEAGRYKMTTVQKGRSGVGPGEHVVTISLLKQSAPEVEGGEIREQELLPARYNVKTGLRFTVPPEGTDQANFDLTSKK